MRPMMGRLANKNETRISFLIYKKVDLLPLIWGKEQLHILNAMRIL